MANDYEKFLALLAAQKTKVPFFLYAYCLMSNHVHLLIERQADAVGRIMHWLLTGYAQYYNHRYRRVGSIAGYTGKYTTSRSHARDKIKSAAGKDGDRRPGGDCRRQQTMITQLLESTRNKPERQTYSDRRTQGHDRTLAAE